MQSSGIEMHVAVRAKNSGTSVRVKEFGLNGMTFIEGRMDQPYSIVLRNSTPERVLIVLSVDGLDVISGQPATSESNGYVLDGYSSAEISGWRISIKEVNQFVFKAKSASYTAAMHGTDTDCGVIACRVFQEIRPILKPTFMSGLLRSCGTDASSAPEPSYTSCSTLGSESKAVACASVGSAPEFNMGTGWGAAQSSVVNETHFRRGALLTEMNIYYADAQSLEKAGITRTKGAAIAVPQGFRGFCQPPPMTT